METTELQRARERLLRRRHELTARSRTVNADLRRELDPLSPDFAEQATQRENDDVLLAIGESGANEVRQNNAALQRIADGEYGICRACGAEIAAARLEVVPHAMYCAQCADKERER
jgi:RNA polymerase-binding protein DksA